MLLLIAAMVLLVVFYLTKESGKPWASALLAGLMAAGASLVAANSLIGRS